MFHYFTNSTEGIALPEKFTWPFHYVPHPLSCLAANEVMQYIASRSDWHEELALGKMFGVLIASNADGELGFLAAFSGNLAGSNYHEYFVPAVYDMLRPDEFFKHEDAEISNINRIIKDLEASKEYISLQEEFSALKLSLEATLASFKQECAARKANRDLLRLKGLADEATLILESQRDNADLQRLKRQSKMQLEQASLHVAEYKERIEGLRKERHARSSALQIALFQQFRMLNAKGEAKDLIEIFAATPQHIPPAGAGECAAPKLLQYAYIHGFKPLAMAEFWWGASPRGEVRHHGQYYPSCNSKCKPILTFMMQGLDVEPNPLMEIVPPEPKILYEDEYLVIIDKPCGMLSVEGKSGVRSAERWFAERYPEYQGPAIVHRLDQSTSGILVMAKSKEVHKELQAQFINRSVRKSYVALLKAKIQSQSGRISLPMKLDYDNRPRQMVSAEGKSAVTDYEVIGYEGDYTRVRFYPLTGRTHQLRLHSAHHEGLNAPIVGDDIYGTGEHNDSQTYKRLCLHAERLEFLHPITKEQMTIECKAEF